MIRMTVTGDVKKMRRHLDQTQRRAIPSAAAGALNYTTGRVRTALVRAIAQAKQVPAKHVRRKTRMGGNLRARPKRLTAELLAWYGAINVSKMNPRRTRKGVRAGRHAFPGAFLQRPKGHDVVFRRVSRKRYPIEVVRIELEPQASSLGRGVVLSEGPRFFSREFERLLRLRLARIR